MQKNIIKLSIISLIIFIIGVFFVGLNKNSTYDTKNLIGQKISKIQLEHFTDNRIITEDDLKKNTPIINMINKIIDNLIIFFCIFKEP